MKTTQNVIALTNIPASPEGHEAVAKNRQPRQPPPATRRLISLPLDLRLFSVVKAFIELREARNEADYNLDQRWDRPDAVNTIEIARRAFADWTAIRAMPNVAVFVAALLLQKHWGRS